MIGVLPSDSGDGPARDQYSSLVEGMAAFVGPEPVKLWDHLI